MRQNVPLDGRSTRDHRARSNRTDEIILPNVLDGIGLGKVMRRVRQVAELTRYQMEKALGQKYIGKIEGGSYTTVQLRTLLKWCEAADHEIVIRPRTRAPRVDTKRL